MSYERIEYKHLLHAVSKPARYIDYELNSASKMPCGTTVNICLAFPDVYEVGFSHLGLKILYSILNNQSDTVADRVYAPWKDFGDILRENDLPLFALESEVALKDFDMLGFTLQTELTYTNILYMLDLAEIPLFSYLRKEEDPLVIAGGPGTANPAPLSPIIDAFLIGDAEEAILEIKECFKQKRDLPRDSILRKLSAIEGMYVPSIHDEENNRIKARKWLAFDDESKIHTDQLIPWLQPTHDRYVAEVMRGCSRGCRFCFAGMFYRPVRERDAKSTVARMIEEVKKYGWQDAALTSLSTSDYTCIKPVLVELFNQLHHTHTSLSFPSLRIDTIDAHLAKILTAMRQTGLTIAPEAGSQNLRNRINKNISEEDILESIRTAQENGWKLIKLYFMIGLPGETDADIDAIVDLVKKIITRSEKKLKINITLSPFVPKPFTPFQWAKMDNLDSLQQKANKIKYALKRFRFVTTKYHEPSSSLLECVIGRGDKTISRLIYDAYINGAVFDSWNEYFDFDHWQKAAEKNEIDFADYTDPIPLKDTLPWDNIDIGIKKEFLQKEWEKAKLAETTEDCRFDGSCIDCGICSSTVKHVNSESFTPSKIVEPQSNPPEQKYSYRVFYQKIGDLIFVSHLDWMRMFQQLLRSSKLPIAYSQGFNPHPIISFGHPLSTGVAGLDEYFDVKLTEEIEPQVLYESLRQSFAPHVPINSVSKIKCKAELAMDHYQYETIEIIIPPLLIEDFAKKTDRFIAAESWIYTYQRKGKQRQINLKEVIKDIGCERKKVELTKKVSGANILNVILSIYGFQRTETIGFRITRKKLHHSL
jgi:radical SAM family uncharacterized protein/radical SAM-linked protein